MHKSFVDEDLIGTSWLVFRLQACGYNFIHIVEYPVSSWLVKAILFCDYQHFQIHTHKKNFQTGNFETAFYENQLICVVHKRILSAHILKIHMQIFVYQD